MLSGFFRLERCMKLEKIVILGGGTAGWMTAAALSKHFANKVEITLVESEQIGTVGVGEATIPTIRRFYKQLGLSDKTVIAKTNATFKFGIEFVDWQKSGHSFIHPFGLFGQGTPSLDFHHYWLRARTHDSTIDLQDYSLGVQLAKNNKVLMPNKPQNQLEIFDWALHFDAALFARLMRETAETIGVNRVEAKVKSVQKSKEDISALILESGELISGDLFIDCSGFKAELIGKALEVDYLDWSNYLLCDSAIAVQTEKTGEISNKTISKAKSAGWQWRIPLTTRMGNGYVYSSKHINDEDAELEFLSSLEGDMTSALRKFKFTPGRRANAWQSNCVSIGLSSGFLEPLESTSIALIETAIAKLIDLIPDNQISSDTAKKFNYATALEYERVRDFIIMHYVLSQRDDTQFWLDCRNVSIPETLKSKLQNYEQNAELKPLPWDIFGKDSWLALLDGLGMYPSKYNERANNMPIEYLQKHLAFMKQEIDNLVGKGVEHERFLREEINLNE